MASISETVPRESKEARDRAVRRVLLWILLANVVVCGAKLVAGYLAESVAVLSDGIHSSIDALNNVVGLVLLRLASKEADEGHPYGHGKIETLGAFCVAGFMFITGYEIAKRSGARLLGAETPAFDISGLTFAVMVGTFAVNVVVVTLEKRASRRYESQFLLADALHTQSDVFVTLSVLVGLPFVMRGYHFVDAVLALAISAVIARSGYLVLKGAVPILLDAAIVDAETIRRLALGLPHVVGVENVRSRLHGGEKFVELTLIVSETDLREAHDLTERLEERIAEAYGRASVTIHVEPAP